MRSFFTFLLTSILLIGASPNISRGQSITPDQTEITAGPSAGNASVNVTADVEWTVDENIEWLSAVRNGASLDISYDANEGIISRDGVITLTDGGTVSATVTVTQNGAEPSLSVAPDNQNVGSSSGATTFNVTANFTTWDINESVNWLTAVKNGSQIDVEFDQNTLASQRIGTITIEGEGESKQVTVTQAGAEPSLSVTPGNQNVASASGSINFTVNTNQVSWSFSTEDAWLTPSQNSNQLNAGFTANPTINQRIGTITVTAGSLSQDVTVTQAGADPALTVSPSNQDVTSAAGSTSFTVASNFNTWTPSESENWLTAVKSGDNVNITYEENTSTSERTGTITVSGEGITRNVTVTQAGAAAYITPSETIVNTGSGNSQTSVSVSSNVAWTVSENISWLTANKNGNNLIIDYDANPGVSNRSGIINLNSAEGATATVTVNQAGASPSLSISPTSETASKDGETIPFTVTSNTAWEASDNADWVTLNINANQISAVVAANSTASSRTATITVTGTGVSPVTAAITQSAGDIFITPSQTALSPSSAAGETALTVSSNVPWTPSSNAAWLTYEKNGVNLTISYSANGATTSRTGTITLTGSPSGSAAITVTQAGAAANLSISPNSETAVKGGETIPFTVTSNITWNAAVNVSWVTLNINASQISAVVAANNTVSSRTATITVSGSGVSPVTATITQAAGDAFINPAQTTLTPGSAAGQSKITFSSNVTLSASSNAPDWLTYSMNGLELTIKYEANTEITSRTGTITLTGAPSGSASVTVTQAGAAAAINVEPETKTVSYAAGNTSYTVTANFPDWTVDKTGDWITSSTKSGNTINVVYTANGTINARTGKIIAKGNGVFDTVSITQEAGPTDITISPASREVTYTAGNTDFTVSSNVPDWTVSDNADWLQAGRSGNAINVSYDMNSEVASRQAVISVTGNGVTKQVTVTQAAAPAYITPDETSVALGNAGGSETLNVSSNVSWTISENISWLSASKSGSQLIINYEANSTVELRTGTITLSNNAQGVSTAITVNQAAGLPYITPASEEVNISSYMAGSSFVNVSANIAWTATESSDWFDISYTSSRITINYTENMTVSAKSGSITVTGSGVTKTISVAQIAGPERLTVNPLTQTLGHTEGDASFTVESNVPWTVNENLSWLITTKDAGRFMVGVIENTSADSRSGNLTVRGNTLTKIVSITQSGAPPLIDAEPENSEVAYTSGSTGFTVTGNFTNWSVSDNADWITASKSGSQVNVSYQENKTVNARIAKVIVSGRGVSDTVTVTQQAGPSDLNVTPLSRSAAYTAGETSFSVTANVEWNVTEDLTWLSAIKDGSQIIVSFEENPATNGRTGNLILSGGSITHMLTVTQEGRPEEITLTPSNIEVSYTAGTASFDVAVNTESWSVSENVSWLAVAISGSKTNISYESNSSVSPRSGKITITAGDSSKTFTITQQGTPTAISSNPGSANVSFLEGGVSFNITSNVEWTVSETVDWLTAEKSGLSVQVNYTKNLLREQRLGTVTVSGGGYSLNINITQGGNLEVAKPVLISPANNVYVPGLNLPFNWNKPALADTYTLEISDSAHFANIIYSYNDIADSVYIIANLKEGMQYYWRIKASNAHGYFSYSDVWGFIAKLLQPGNLRISQNAFNEVILSWQDNSKNETGYDILRKTGSGEFAKLISVPSGQVNYIDAGITSSGLYVYKVYAYNTVSVSDTSEVSINVTVIGTEDDPTLEIPAEYSLSNAYPNPFNPSAKVKYGLPEESAVVIEVFNILGEKVETLLNEQVRAGYHEIRWNAETMPSGIYIIRTYARGLSTGKEFVSVKKAMLLK